MDGSCLKLDDQVPPSRSFTPREARRSAPLPEPPVKRRRRWTWPALLIVLAATVGTWLWRQSGSSAPARVRVEVPQAVGTATVARGDLPIVLTGLGTVTPLATATVRSQISGTLVEVDYREGQTVAKGDFLAQIDPRPYQVALEQAQGTLAKDEALLQQAQSDLTRYQTLIRQDSIARQQVDTQESLVHQYEATLRTDQAGIDAQNLNLAYARITAPIEGRTGLRQVDAGNYVQAGGTPGLVVITQLRPITVIFSLPEDELAAVQKRLHAGAKLRVTLRDRSDSTEIATGALDTIDNVVDVATGTFKLRATFPNDDETLFPNQFVNVQLLVDTQEGATLVPNSAVQTGIPGTYVYLVNADSTVSVRPVAVGATDGARTAIMSGLAVGDRVVVDGADRLRDGSKVALAEAAGTARSDNPANATPREGGRRARSGAGSGARSP